MIGYLKGTVISKDEKNIVVAISGVGYNLALPSNFLDKVLLENLYEFWVYTHVKEDTLALFGFETKEDRVLFGKVLGISGVGPKTALDIISTPRKTLINTVNMSNVALLTTIPGIGKKTAERLLLDLKSVFEKFVPEVNLAQDNTKKNVSIDIIGALENLGFRKDEIVKVLNKIPGSMESEEEIMKFALREINQV